MTFDAQHSRRMASENFEMYLGMHPKADGPIGNYGADDVRVFIDQALASYADKALPLLHRANQRIDQGLANKEYEWFGGCPAQHRYVLHKARALGTWLESNELAEGHWTEARNAFEFWWRGPEYVWPRQEIIREGLDTYMAMAVLGCHFEDGQQGRDSLEAGIDMYEHWTGKDKVSLGKLLKPRELGYALCRHYLNGEFDAEDLLAAGRRMLAANLSQPQPYCNGWLENGQELQTAMWLMIIHWYPAMRNCDEMPQPVDVVLKAYDDMPDVTRPF